MAMDVRTFQFWEDAEEFIKEQTYVANKRVIVEWGCAMWFIGVTEKSVQRTGAVLTDP